MRLAFDKTTQEDDPEVAKVHTEEVESNVVERAEPCRREPEPSSPQQLSPSGPPRAPKRKVSEMDEVEQWCNDLELHYRLKAKMQTRLGSAPAVVSTRERSSTSMTPTSVDVVESTETKRLSIFRSSSKKKLMKSAPGIDSLPPTTRARAGSVAPRARARSSTFFDSDKRKSAGNVKANNSDSGDRIGIGLNGPHGPSEEEEKLTRLRVSCGTNFETWKTFESICEALMMTLIKKEKNPDSVPQEASRINSQLVETAGKVKKAKGMFLLEKLEIRTLWEAQCAPPAEKH